MKVLVAGAAGDLGTKTSELLFSGGHEVWALTRSEERAAELLKKGLKPVIGDLLDAASTAAAVAEASPDAIVQVPIALPQRGPLRPRDMKTTNHLRVVGTKHLVDAAIAAGVRRLVVESIVAIYGYGDVDGGKLDEDSPTETEAPFRAVQPALDAIHTLESLVLDATRAGRIEGIVARLGFYYGGDVGSTQFMATLLRKRAMPVTKTRGAMPWIEINDAAAGVVAALEHGRPGEIYNIVGDESAGLTDLGHELAKQLGTRPPRELPSWVIRMGGRYAALMGVTRLHVSNEKAKRELGWKPQFPTIREGIAHAAPALSHHP